MWGEFERSLKDRYCVLNFGHYSDKGAPSDSEKKFKLILSGSQQRLFNFGWSKLLLWFVCWLLIIFLAEIDQYNI